MKNKNILTIVSVITLVVSIATTIHIHRLNNTSTEFGPAEETMAKRYGSGWTEMVTTDKTIRKEWYTEMLSYPDRYVKESVVANLESLK